MFSKLSQSQAIATFRGGTLAGIRQVEWMLFPALIASVMDGGPRDGVFVISHAGEPYKRVPQADGSVHYDLDPAGYAALVEHWQRPKVNLATGERAKPAPTQPEANQFEPLPIVDAVKAMAAMNDFRDSFPSRGLLYSIGLSRTVNREPILDNNGIRIGERYTFRADVTLTPTMRIGGMTVTYTGMSMPGILTAQTELGQAIAAACRPIRGKVRELKVTPTKPEEDDDGRITFAVTVSVLVEEPTAPTREGPAGDQVDESTVDRLGRTLAIVANGFEEVFGAAGLPYFMGTASSVASVTNDSPDAFDLRGQIAVRLTRQRDAATTLSPEAVGTLQGELAKLMLAAVQDRRIDAGHYRRGVRLESPGAIEQLVGDRTTDFTVTVVVTLSRKKAGAAA